MSYATILIPGSGIVTAYTSVDEFNQAIGIYLITWFVLTFMLLYVPDLSRWFGVFTTFRIGALRKNVGFIALLFFLAMTFLLLAVAAWTGKTSVNKAGGAMGIVTAWIAYYCGLSELLVKDESWFGLPLGRIN